MRRFLLAMLLAVFTLAPAVPLAAAPSAGSVSRSGQVSLQTMLETGLRARRTAEFTFVRKVVERVDEGTLPRSVVESTFLWARNKQPWPFPYFEEGLRQRAKKLGISL